MKSRINKFRFSKVLACFFACVVLLSFTIAPAFAVSASCIVSDYLVSTEVNEDGETVKIYDMPCRSYVVVRSYDHNGNLTDTYDDWGNDITIETYSSDDAYFQADICPWYDGLFSNTPSPVEVGAVDVSSVAFGGPFSAELEFLHDYSYAYLYDVAVWCKVSFYDDLLEPISSLVCPEVFVCSWGDSLSSVATYSFDAPDGTCFLSVRLYTSRGYSCNVTSFSAITLTTTTPAPAAEPVANEGIYYSAFDLFQRYVYGENVELTSDQQLTLTFMATLACLFLVSLPFVLVWLFIKVFR